VAQQEPVRFSMIEGAQHLQGRVPATPVTTVYANSVEADPIIAPDGSVESVTVLKGNPAHVASATAALKQWTFAPFLQEGRTVRAIVTANIYVPDELPSQAEINNVNAFRLLNECERLVNAKDGSAAEIACAKAIEAVDQLPADAVLERSGARTWLGHALLLQRRPREALAQYEQGLALRRRVASSDDADVASTYRHIGTARFAMGDLQAADQNLSQAVVTMEAAIISLPSERRGYQERLRTMLREHATVKRALGDTASALALEQKAAGLSTNP
jgi:tetratricopeptide (TPR) repeat protein